MSVSAKVTTEFNGVEDGKVYPRLITVGEEIHGSLAQTAIDEKWAKETKESRQARNAADDESSKAAADQAAADAADAAVQEKRAEDKAKLGLLTHAQLEA